MGKKKIALISGLIIVTVIIIVIIVFNLLQQNQVSSPVTLSQPTPTSTEEVFATWEDQAEFSFHYPNSLVLDPHDEDDENYAHVELKSATYSGNLIVWVKDTFATDITDWERKEKINNAIDSTLDGEKAKKVLFTGESKKIITSSIYGGYLYQIEVNPTDFDYWNRVYNQVISSFKFISTGAVGSKTTVTSLEGEETNDIPIGESFEEEFIE